MHSNISSYSGDASARIGDGISRVPVLVMLKRDPLPPFDRDLATTYGEWWGYLRIGAEQQGAAMIAAADVETLTLEREERAPMSPRTGWPLDALPLDVVMLRVDPDAVHVLVQQAE